MPDPTDQNVDRFIRTIAPWSGAYSSCGLSYLAVRDGQSWMLLHGRIFLSAHPLQVSHEIFKTDRIVAGHMPLGVSTEGHSELIRSIFATGEIAVPIGKVVLRKEESGGLFSYYDPFHSEGLTGQNRLPVLTIRGRSRHGLLEQPAIDWELKAAATPFDSLTELGGAYSLGGYSGDATALEVIASPVVSVAMDSVVSGTRAEISILAAFGLERSRCRLGYRVLSNRSVVKRGSFDGDQLSWTTDGSQSRGAGQIEIPQAAILQCYASYGDCTQHHYWIGDPRNFQNPLRMALQANDPDLQVLRDYLFEEKKERKESRNFESGVSLLAWMLGFNSAHIGATPRLSDAPDVVASTPKGDMFIIECTTALLKADNKLSKLIERARAIKNNLDASGNGHVRVLPVIVTALERGAIEAELALAKSSGVIVATKETLHELISRTVGVADPQGLFDEIWASFQSEADLSAAFKNAN